MRMVWTKLKRKRGGQQVFEQRVLDYQRIWIQDLDPDSDPEVDMAAQDDLTKAARVLTPDEVTTIEVFCPECNFHFVGFRDYLEHLKQPGTKTHIHCPVRSTFLLS